MDYDEILIQINEFGRHQKRVFLLLCIATITMPFHSFGQVFFAINSPHWCIVPHWENANCSSINMTAYDCKEYKKNISMALEVDERTGILIYSQCAMYDMRDIGFPPEEYDLINVSETLCVDGWDHDTAIYGETIKSEYDIVCENDYLDAVAQAFYFIGHAIGAAVFGYISDWFGRRSTWILMLSILSFSSVMTYLSTSFWFYTTFRIFSGAASYGAWLMPFIMATELVGPSKRMTVGIALNYCWALGYMALAGAAWLIKGWRNLQLAIALSTIATFVLVPFIPESPRWLISRRKYNAAKKVLKKAAKENKVDLPEQLLQIKNVRSMRASKDNVKARDIIKSPSLLCRLFIMCFCWLVHGLAYAGLSLGVDLIGLNVYLSFFLSGGVEIPAYTVTIICLSYVGRRNSTIGFMLSGGISLCLCTISSNEIYRASLVLFSKFAVSASFVIVLIYNSELFPTKARGFAIGVASFATNVAVIASPFFLMLSRIWEPLTFITFGALLVMSALSILLLPETRGTFLPETIQEAIDIGKSRQRLPDGPTDEEAL